MVNPEILTDEELKACNTEAFRRGVLDLDTTPAELAAAVMADPEARSALARLMVGRRTKSTGQKPIAPAVLEAMQRDREAGRTMPEIAARHGVSVRSVARYTRKKEIKSAP